jgi:hypothetical protein
MVENQICTSPDEGPPAENRKTGHTCEKDKVKLKHLPLKYMYVSVSTNDGNKGRITKDKTETNTHASMTASRRLPFHMPKVPSDESVWVKRERMKRRKGKKQVVHCNKIKICKAQVLRGEGTELGIEYTEQGSSGTQTLVWILKTKMKTLGHPSKVLRSQMN